ncbi:hypothetical protein D8M04_14695 [Oceanobacillus piezotolerans]|uniref:DUF4181 domain-containing protein n=1 Tax=Oceanobacillus piezotolerans TaxID=2448030 RepID=A0A498DK42_9BACI|nr:hypothetical protein [Oceanobacillus piezotolerans]RLL42795.1 hypothetical protein D8M04_14695 [Oceanobacillus piezotolerans]
MNPIGIIILLTAMIFAYASAFFVLKKKKYYFISRLRNRTSEEINQLEKTGYIKANGKLILFSAYILSAGLILELIGVPFAFQVCLILVILFYLVGTIYIQKYEVKERRKNAYMTTTISVVITIAIIAFILIRLW